MYLLTKPTQSSKLQIKLAFQRLLGYYITQKIHLKDKEKTVVNLWQQPQEERMMFQVKPQDAFVNSETIPEIKRRTWWLSECRREHLHGLQWNTGHRNALAGKDACCQDSSEFDPQNPRNTELTLESCFLTSMYEIHKLFFLKSFNRSRLTDGGGVQIMS